MHGIQKLIKLAGESTKKAAKGFKKPIFAVPKKTNETSK
jgi:hypothetical protein